jgi:ribosome-binding factor A
MSLNTERLSKTLMRELSILLSREAKDHNLASVTITEVRVTNDLSFANIYYTVPDFLKDKIKESLDRSKGFLRSELARRVKARKMPELIFKYDEALEYGNHINEILNKLNNQE